MHLREKLTICMTSDFFHPNIGGVEEHIYNLSQCLILSGYKVIVVTHAYDNITGVHYFTNGLKVFYLPIVTFYNGCVLPTMVSCLPLIRNVLLREKVEIVHGHSAFSALAHEVMIIGKLLGLKTVFTDHSLFGFADTSAAITNKFLEISLANVDHCICVSHIGKENTVLRAKVSPVRVSVIPNAVDTKMFTPDITKRPKDRIVIVSVNRLVYRKGIDLLAQIIVDLCSKYNNVDFIVAGSGPKMSLLEEVVSKHSLFNRVQLLGAIEHKKVRSVLNKGHIFLNCSLTEAYCMGIVEAVACGLQVVCTKVGGIPEVIRPDLVFLREPSVHSLIDGLECAIADHKLGKAASPEERYLMVKQAYSWFDVAGRTEIVYNSIKNLPHSTLGCLLKNYLKSGVWPFLLVISLMWTMLSALEWIIPRKNIDVAKDYGKHKNKILL